MGYVHYSTRYKAGNIQAKIRERRPTPIAEWSNALATPTVISCKTRCYIAGRAGYVHYSTRYKAGNIQAKIRDRRRTPIAEWYNVLATPTVISCKTRRYIAGRAGYVHYSTRYKAGNIQAKIRDRRRTPIAEWYNALATPTVISCKTRCYIAGRAGYVHYSTRYKAGNIQAKIRDRRRTPIAEWSNALATPTVISCKTRCYIAGRAGYVHYSTRYKAGNIQAKIRERGPTPIAEWSNALATPTVISCKTRCYIAGRAGYVHYSTRYKAGNIQAKIRDRRRTPIAEWYNVLATPTVISCKTRRYIAGRAGYVHYSTRYKAGNIQAKIRERGPTPIAEWSNALATPTVISCKTRRYIAGRAGYVHYSTRYKAGNIQAKIRDRRRTPIAEWYNVLATHTVISCKTRRYIAGRAGYVHYSTRYKAGNIQAKIRDRRRTPIAEWYNVLATPTVISCKTRRYIAGRAGYVHYSTRYKAGNIQAKIRDRRRTPIAEWYNVLATPTVISCKTRRYIAGRAGYVHYSTRYKAGNIQAKIRDRRRTPIAEWYNVLATPTVISCKTRRYIAGRAGYVHYSTRYKAGNIQAKIRDRRRTPIAEWYNVLATPTVISCKTRRYIAGRAGYVHYSTRYKAGNIQAKIRDRRRTPIAEWYNVLATHTVISCKTRRYIAGRAGYVHYSTRYKAGNIQAKIRDRRRTPIAEWYNVLATHTVISCKTRRYIAGRAGYVHYSTRYKAGNIQAKIRERRPTPIAEWSNALTTPTVISCKTRCYIAGRAGYVHYSTRYKAGNIQAKIRERRPTPIAVWSNVLATPTVISCKTRRYIAGRAGYVHYSTRYKAGNIQAKIRERGPTPIAEWSNALATPTVISCKTRCYIAGRAGYVDYSTRYKAGNIQAKIRERGPTPIAEWSNALATHTVISCKTRCYIAGRAGQVHYSTRYKAGNIQAKIRERGSTPIAEWSNALATHTVISCKTRCYIAGRAGQVHYSTRYKAGNIQAKIRERGPTPIAEWSNALATHTVISCKTRCYIAGRAGQVHYSTRYKAGNIQVKIRDRRPTPIAEWSNALATPTVISCKTRCYIAGRAGYVHYSTRYKAGNIQAKIRERRPTPIAEWSNALATPTVISCKTRCYIAGRAGYVHYSTRYKAGNIQAKIRERRPTPIAEWSNALLQ